MKMTGDDELDFIREGSAWVLNRQVKVAAYSMGAEAVILAVVGGLIAILSTTVAAWVAVIGGGIILAQGILLSLAQWKARSFIKKNTESTEALDAITRGFFG